MVEGCGASANNLGFLLHQGWDKKVDSFGPDSQTSCSSQLGHKHRNCLAYQITTEKTWALFPLTFSYTSIPKSVTNSKKYSP